MRVEPGTGTGADNSLNIHVSISLTSCNAIDGVCSVDWLLKIDQILSLQNGKKKKRRIKVFILFTAKYGFVAKECTMNNIIKLPYNFLILLYGTQCRQQAER